MPEGECICIRQSTISCVISNMLRFMFTTNMHNVLHTYISQYFMLNWVVCLVTKYYSMIFCSVVSFPWYSLLSQCGPQRNGLFFHMQIPLETVTLSVIITCRYLAIYNTITKHFYWLFELEMLFKTTNSRPPTLWAPNILGYCEQHMVI